MVVVIHRQQPGLTRVLIAAAVAALLTGGCTTPFEPGPMFVLPDRYHAVEVAGEAGTQAVLSPEALAVWWTQFGDPVMGELVELALIRNNDLKIALARVDQARAVERGARSLLFPTVGVGAQAKRYHGGETESILLNQMGIDEFTATYWQTGLQVGWEPDLFGSGRARLEAARDQRTAAVADVQAVRLSLAATVASAYVGYRGLQEQQKVLIDSLQQAKEFLDIAERSFKAGVGLSTDIHLAQAGVAQVQARLERTDNALVQARLNLENLCMAAPGSLDAKLAIPEALPAVPATMTPGQPVDLLMRRPDLIAAEARFHATLKQGEAARLDYLPKFSLGGLLGRSALDVGSEVSTTSNLWLVSLAMVMPLIDFGARESQVELMDARSREALLAYERTALGALFDVERALARLSRDEQLLRAVKAEVGERVVVLRNTQRQYELGDAGRLEIAQARVSLLESQSALVSQQVMQLQTHIALFLAMGGGWHLEDGQESLVEKTEKP